MDLNLSLLSDWRYDLLLALSLQATLISAGLVWRMRKQRRRIEKSLLLSTLEREGVILSKWSDLAALFQQIAFLLLIGTSLITPRGQALVSRQFAFWYYFGIYVLAQNVTVWRAVATLRRRQHGIDLVPGLEKSRPR